MNAVKLPGGGLPEGVLPGGGLPEGVLPGGGLPEGVLPGAVGFRGGPGRPKTWAFRELKSSDGVLP